MGSVDSGCYICDIIFQDCNDSQRELAKSFQIFYRFYNLQEEGFEDGLARYGLRFGIEVEQTDHAAFGEFFYDCQGDFKLLPYKGTSRFNRSVMLGEVLSYRCEDIKPWVMEQPIPANTADPQCLDLARRWLTECLQSHKNCPPPAVHQKFYPSRLLNLGNTLNATTCRLQNCAAEIPTGPYCTLSHRWGKGEFVNLRSETLHKLERGISTSSLSKKFQDAIYAVRSLGVHYLWIDALCIIQDSPEDWGKEAACMAEIYAKSYCNIAATDAINGRGCFVNRPICRVKPCLLDSSIFTKASLGHYAIAYDDFWSINLRNAPLHRRGWVLQERLLSPRTIHFSSKQIFWECGQHTACESYPRGIPSQIKNPRTKAWRLFDSVLSGSQPTLLPEVHREHSKLHLAHEQWKHAVEWYMECRISYSKDKLSAIAGIAHTVAGITCERYLAGLWENEDLAIQLLWHVLSRRQADNSPSQRSELYRAPSWSWACLEATIVWDWPSSYNKILVSVVEATATPRGSDNMCEISYAALKVCGCLFEAKLEIAHVKADGSYDEDGEYNLLIEYEEIYEDDSVVSLALPIEGPVIHLDTALEPTPTSNVYCLPMCTEWAGKPGSGAVRIAGLLLLQNPQAETQYSRIGIFGLDTAEACHFCGLDIDESDRLDEVLCSMPCETFTIV